MVPVVLILDLIEFENACTSPLLRLARPIVAVMLVFTPVRVTQCAAVSTKCAADQRRARSPTVHPLSPRKGQHGLA
jgi:hypothetical protein